MRRIVLAMIMAGVVHGAQAADLPDLTDVPVLRGALHEGLRPVRWQGFYVGGQAGTGSSDMDFSGSTQNMVASLLVNTGIENVGQVSQWPVLGKKSQRGDGYGGFAGYNSQWGDVVLGLEANYMHGNFGGSDTNTMSRFFDVGTFTDFVDYNATTRFMIKDMGSVRARAGWAWGSFLPYMFGGVSLGRADVYRNATVSGTQVEIANPANVIPFSFSRTEGQSNRFIYGYAAGLGVDVMLVGGLFARAEWEYLKFAGPIDTSINTVRGGLGYRF
ncbi:outer membrane beta-barrel protein [soil metagenome]